MKIALACLVVAPFLPNNTLAENGSCGAMGHELKSAEIGLISRNVQGFASVIDVYRRSLCRATSLAPAERSLPNPTQYKLHGRGLATIPRRIFHMGA
jgi:hypothetical protein